jgi:tRNA threonylcarbamoyladenosine biosynthesis protein TsaE
MTAHPQLFEVGRDAASEVVRIIHEAFADRPTLDPPATALDETAESVAVALREHGGLMATLDGRPVGALLLEPGTLPGAGPGAGSLLLRRVSVCPDAQQHGVARALRAAAEELARRRGFRRVHLTARSELPSTVAFWDRGGYREVARHGTTLTLARELPVQADVPTAEAMQALGERLARRLRPGDLVILTGDLGAGKTTMTQGLGVGLGVRGGITSPTFVISRIHPSLVGGPALVHVDAYRLGGLAELDDLDLDVSLDDSVTVVEWGAGMAETLAEDRLEVVVSRSLGGTGGADRRTVRIVPVGARWVGSDLADVVA